MCCPIIHLSTLRLSARKLQRDLHERVVAAKTGKELAQVIDEFPEPLDEINISSSLSRFVQFKRKRQTFPVPSALLSLDFTQISQPRTTSSVLWAAGALESPEMLRNFHVPTNLQLWSIRDLVSGLWGVASAGGEGGRDFVMAAVNELSTRPLRDAKNQELASLLWSCAKTSNAIPAVFIDDVAKRVDGLNGQDISMVVWSLAKLEVPADDLFGRISDRLSAAAPEMAPQAVANIVWAFSVNHRKKNKALFESLAKNFDLGTLSPEQTSALLLAFAKEEAELPDGVIRWKNFPLREHLNCAWALARYPDSGNFLPCVDALNERRDLHKMTADDIYAITRALAASFS